MTDFLTALHAVDIELKKLSRPLTERIKKLPKSKKKRKAIVLTRSKKGHAKTARKLAVLAFKKAAKKS